jgi:pantoate--beta-alanine ligase
MGALHEGHLSLVRRAREQCDLIVVSVFVNPAQFNESSDLERYPRREADDAALAAAAGADVLFAPSVEEVYPPGFATAVEVIGITDRLEGAIRGSGHFGGVTTVVTKLLGMAMPDVAYFGQKDAQQAVVVRRLVSDLNLSVRIEVCPTVREPDGLAMSSRNALLDPDQRARARSLFDALEAAAGLAARGERSSDALVDAALQTMRSFGVVPEYVALVDPETLEPVGQLAGEALLAIAARIGDVRLIDNTILEPDRASISSQPLTGGAITTCNA